MLSPRLLELIEAHWEEIANRLIHALRNHPDTPNLARKPDAELKEWCRAILKNMGALLLGADKEIARRYRRAGRARYEEDVPLHEAVLRVQLLKDKILAFINEQALPMTTLHLYAEEELERRIGRFFDLIVYSLVRGYEDAQKLARTA